jgi:hypothetical protein
MEQFQREFFVYRLTSNYQRFKRGSTVLKIITPTPNILYEGQETYLETLETAREYNIATDEDIDKLLRERELWSDYDEDQLVNVLPKHIEYWKVEIFNRFGISKERKQLELHLDAARTGLQALFARKHSFDHFTQHGLATFARWQKLVELSTFNMDDTPYDWSEVGINDVLEFISKNTMNEEIIRDVARNEPWKSIWMAGKRTGNLFGKPSVSLSDEQRRIVNWSGLYDNVSEYPDCPVDEIIAHDDAFDGWLILKNREREKTQREESFKKKHSSTMDAPEVGIVMSDEDRENPQKFRETVYGMNDPTSRMIVNNRFNTINRLGECKDTDFADVQRDINKGLRQVTSRKGR